MVEICVAKNAYERRDIPAVGWIRSENNLADGLKNGAVKDFGGTFVYRDD